MTNDPQDLNREALEAMGWKFVRMTGSTGIQRDWGIPPGIDPDDLDYPGEAIPPDLRTENAMAKAEKWLEKELGDLFLYRGHETNRKESMAYWGLARVPRDADDDDYEVIVAITETECLSRLEVWIEVYRRWKEQKPEGK